MTAVDGFSRSMALNAPELLARFNQAGVIAAADIHVATRMASLLDESSQAAQLALAITVAAVRRGSICVDLSTVSQMATSELLDDADVPWPDPDSWIEEVRASAFVSREVVRLEGTNLYLDRYWREEKQVCDDFVARLTLRPPEIDQPVLDRGLLRVFPDDGYDEQRLAVQKAASQWTTILTGGPGTGKTTTVAGLLALICEQHEQATGQSPRIALCAPTGKASARLQEAIDGAAANFVDPEDRRRVSELDAMTIHRLLGWVPERTNRFRHDRSNRLPHDVIVVDEASMVALTMMARLLEAVRPETRLLLVGDADQLSSVEAGAVLADLVAGLRDVEPTPVFALRKTHRYGEHIGALAEALRNSDADQVMEILHRGDEQVQWIRPDDEAAVHALQHDLSDNAFQMRVAASEGDATEALRRLGHQRLLCAHREGPYGVGGWNRLIERLVGERARAMTYDEWYAGRPVLITVNDGVLKLRNGDVGVTIRDPQTGRLRVAIDELARRDFAPTRLSGAETMYAMTVHKSQGSQADVVTVIMPPEDSRLLTRELFYTAVTRAKESVRIVGDEQAIRAAVGREVQRATGLRDRLRAVL